MKEKYSIPREVMEVVEILRKSNHETYLVGGCVRDMLLNRTPKDWDITTDAVPEEILKLFSKTFYENSYGTVGVVNDETHNETLKVIEITPYRLESAYSDKRRPDKVLFSKNIEEDLKRRDFTINAMAIDPFKNKGHILDLYKGQNDIISRTIRTVGDPDVRFTEDALRVLRAVRLSCELDFNIEKSTEDSIIRNSSLLSNISKERIRDEFIKIIMSEHPIKGMESLKKYSILHYISPELEKSIGIEQGGIHKYDVWEHLIRSLQLTADKKWALEIRLAALFHDIAKPHTRNKFDNKNKWSFYGHEVVGAKLTKKILVDLKFPLKTVEKVIKLIRWHMFFSDTEAITHSAVRRLIANVGKENIWDLMNLRVADRIGTGRPKESPYRLRKYYSLIDEVLRDPISVSMLKIDGNGVIKSTENKPGPKIGFILHALLEEVLENPKLNNLDYLEKRSRELITLSEKELKELGESGKEAKEKNEQKKVEQIRKKYFVD